MANDNPITAAKQIHNQIIAGILEDQPQAKTGGFMAALKQLPDADYIGWMAREDPEWFRQVNFVPDAWLINPDDRHVVIYEAVHKHDVPAAKFAKMADLSWALDEDYYRLFLIRCDRFCRTGYDVQSASLCSDLELRWAGEESRGWEVPDWQKYTAKYCDALIKRTVAA